MNTSATATSLSVDNKTRHRNHLAMGYTAEQHVVGDALVVALTKAAGDARKEQEAVQAAIDAYMELAGGGDPFDACLANFFVEDGSVERPPPIERVPGAREEDVLRWRELVLDLAGY